MAAGCKDCHLRFDDLSHTKFAGHHQPLRVWMLCLYLMGLNLSNQQIAAELDLNKDDVQQMTNQLREGIVQNKPQVILEGEVECDEAYVIAGHKGRPDVGSCGLSCLSGNARLIKIAMNLLVILDTFY